MTAALKLKRSYTAARTFALGELSEGEIGINVPDRKIYMRDNNNTIVLLNPSTGSITLAGEATGTGTGTVTVTLANSAVIGKVITGFSSGAGALAATDTILQAINKLDGNIAAKGNGTVTTVSVASANGFAGSVSNAGTTPAITISTSINGLIKGNGTALSAAVAGTDYTAGTSALGTGILKNTTGTGAHTIANATDITNTLGFTPEDASKKGAVNGYAGLDGSGKVPVAQLPASVTGGMNYQGTWNANTNSPTLVNGTGTKGYYYKVGTAGSTTIDGNSSWTVGDVIAFNGTTWDKMEGGQPDVVSVAGRIGAVVLAYADISGLANMAQQASNAVTITGGTIAASTISGNISGNAANVTGTVAVANGGTGATTLTGYVKGTGTTAMTASATIPVGDITGLGTMATQSAASVNITGGTIDGVTIDCGTYV